MSDDYNLDAIPNSIFDNIIMDDSMNMDEIFVDISEDTCLQDPLAIVDYETEIKEVNAKSSPVEYPILQHDCMWSGTCDISHPGKKKAKPFSVEAILKEFEASSESDSDEELRSYMASDIPSCYSGNTQMYQKSMQTPADSVLLQLPSSVPSSLVIQPVQRPKLETSQQYSQFYPSIQPQLVVQPLSHTFRVLSAEEAQHSYIKTESQPMNICNFFPKALQCVTPLQFPFQVPEQQPNNHDATIPQTMVKSEPFIYYNFKSQLQQNSNILFNSVPSSKAPNSKKKKSLEKVEVKSRKLVNKKKKLPKNSKAYYKRVMEQAALNDDELIEKRTNHNDKERQRRIGMRNLYVELKAVIPALSELEHTPKVNILRAAHVYCSEAQDKEKQEEKLLAKLRKENKQLSMKLAKLSSSMSKASSLGSLTSSASSYDDGSE